MKAKGSSKNGATKPANCLLSTHLIWTTCGRKWKLPKQVDANIRCAAPLKESLAAFYPPPVSVTEATIIAADGSQVNPDRHAAIQFCVINVGVIAMKLSSGEAPEVTVETELLYGDDLLPNGNPAL